MQLSTQTFSLLVKSLKTNVEAVVDGKAGENKVLIWFQSFFLKKSLLSKKISFTFDSRGLSN